jgi:hypothetical protein
MKKIILSCLLCVSFSSFSQNWHQLSLSTMLGFTATIGTHSTRLGLTISGHLNYSFAQLNVSNFANFNLFGYGQRRRFWESRTALGLVLLGGKRNNTPDFQHDALLHNTAYSYGLGYNYLWYHDNAKTSQRSGGWALHLKSFSLLLENDVFSGQSKDRFRTGHLALTYRYQTTKYTVGLNIWTGETANSLWQKIALKKCPSGFRLLEDLPYGKTSHGILYFGVTQKMSYVSNIYGRIGIDSERIRHAVQNRLMHDLLFLPKGFPRNTPHYPMLDRDGCPTFENSMVRKSRIYLQGGVNDVWSN